MESTSTIAATYGISLTNMIDRIAWAMQDIYTETEERFCRLAILDFLMTHGDEAVVALFGFIRYVQTSDKTEEEKTAMLQETIRHDINGRKDSTMQPRSASFIEFAKR